MKQRFGILMKPKLKTLLFSSFFINLAAGLFGPLYAIFVERIGGGIFLAGSSYAVFSIASGVLIFFLSKWEDRIEHKEKLLIFSRFLFFLVAIGYIFVRNPTDLILIQVLLGISTAIGAPAFDTIYSENLNKGRFATEWGFWESMRSIVWGIAALTGGLVAAEFGFRVLFFIMAVFAFLSFIASLLLLKNEKKRA